MDKRLERAKINAASTLAHQLVATLCGMVIPWIMIDTFGSAAYGATTSIAQFLAYISLFEGGIGRVARGALYGPLSKHDDDSISKVYLAVKRFFFVIGAVFSVYSIVLAFGYYDIAEVEIFTREYTFALVLVISLSKFAEYVGGISNITLLNADQKQYVVNSAYILTNALNAVLIVILANSGADIIWVKLGSSLVFVLRPVFYTIYVRSHYAIKKTKEKGHLPNKFTGIAQHFAYVIQNNTDVLILTLFSDLKIVAVYSVYHLIIFSIRNIVTAFTGGMEAVFGNMIAKGEHNVLVKTYEKYKLMLIILSFVFFSTTAIMILPFVKLYTSGVSDVNYIYPLFALIMVISEALNCLILPCFNLSIAANKLKESQMGAYGEAIINLVVSVALVFWDPLLGVAIGTLFSAVFKLVFYMAFSGTRILKLDVKRMFRNNGFNILAILFASAIGMYFIQRLSIDNYLHWGLCAAGIASITGLLGIALGYLLYPGETKELIVSVFKKIVNRQTTKDN